MAHDETSTIDFGKYYSALQTVNLMNCQGSVVRVSGSTVESAGPVVGLRSSGPATVRAGQRCFVLLHTGSLRLHNSGRLASTAPNR